MEPGCQLQEGFAKEQGPQLCWVPAGQKQPAAAVYRESVIDDKASPITHRMALDVVPARWALDRHSILVLGIDQLPEELPLGNLCLQAVGWPSHHSDCKLQGMMSHALSQAWHCPSAGITPALDAESTYYTSQSHSVASVDIARER